MALSTPYTFTDTGTNPGIYFLSANYNLADISAADMITTFTIPHNFKIVDIRALVTKPATTASKLATLTAKIGSVAVTGAVLALTSANMTPMGTIQTGTATDITAGGVNQGVAGSTISVTASAVTTFVEGIISLVITIKNLDET